MSRGYSPHIGPQMGYLPSYMGPGLQQDTVCKWAVHTLLECFHSNPTDTGADSSWNGHESTRIAQMS